MKTKTKTIIIVIVTVAALALIAAALLDPSFGMFAKSAADSITPEKIKELADMARR